MKRQATSTTEGNSPKIAKTDIALSAEDVRNIRNSPDIQKLHFLKMKNGNAYDVGKFLGEGMFGLVMEIRNQKNEKFAAKMVKASEEKPEVLKIELDILEKIAQEPHENLLQLIGTEHLIAPPVSLNGTVILTRVLGPSLMDIINTVTDQLSNTEEGITFPIHTIRNVGRQTVQAMLHLESLGIYHLDLKPENVYFFGGKFETRHVDSTWLSIEMADERIQIGDFGCSKWHEGQGEVVKATLVQTQNYRAPEIFMGLPHSTKSDVWSFAAILAEMYTGQLLFYGTHDSETEQAQFELMQRVMMTMPSRRMWKEAAALESKKIVYIEKSRSYRMAKLVTKMEPTLILHENIRRNDVLAVPLFIFLEYVLIFDPIHRPSFQQVVEHKFFN